MMTLQDLRSKSTSRLLIEFVLALVLLWAALAATELVPPPCRDQAEADAGRGPGAAPSLIKPFERNCNP